MITLDMNFHADYEAGARKHFVAACAYTDMAEIEGLVFEGTFHGRVVDGKVEYL